MFKIKEWEKEWMNREIKPRAFIRTLANSLLDEIRQEIVDYDEMYINEAVRKALNRIKEKAVEVTDAKRKLFK
jgi:hypothetical protein